MDSLDQCLLTLISRGYKIHLSALVLSIQQLLRLNSVHVRRGPTVCLAYISKQANTPVLVRSTY